MAEGPGRRSPSIAGTSSSADAPRPEYESIDLIEVEDVVEELPSTIEVGPSSVELIPASVELVADVLEEDDVELPPPSLEAIDVEFDDGNVESILAITGEGWSLDAQRESLKQAAKDDDASAAPPAAPPRPALSIPTPYDFGAIGDAIGEAIADTAAPVEAEPPRPVRAPMRSVPPPLPPATSPAPPSVAPPRSVPPPPPPVRSGSVRPPPVAPREAPRRPAEPRRASLVEPDGARSTPEGLVLVDLLATRLARLADGDDRVGVARAHLELAVVHETLADDAQVNGALHAALDVDADLAPAHAILRRRLHHRTQLVPMLRHLDREIATATGEASSVELLVERARLLAAGDRDDDAREAWELVLGRAPHHSAALKGLEADLARRALTGSDDPTASEDRWEDLVAHLGRMADAYSAQPNLAAWLHVERARILELRLGRVDAARGAYERALRLDGGVGPVRDAFTLHCAAHHDVSRLAELLAEEARLEPSSPRCARLELDAATLTHTLFGNDAVAIALLEDAAARAPTTPSVDRRVLDELVMLYERSGQLPEAASARRRRLPFFVDAASQVYEWRRLAAIEERLGNVDQAIADLERALGIEPDDATLIAELDRLLALAGKESVRVALWHAVGQRVEGPRRASALSKAADLAEALGMRDDALRHLRAAWVAAPGDAEVLDQLSRLMTPARPEGFDREVRALIDLYAQAAASTRDTGRRIAYLEKVGVLWEELVGDQLRATRTYEEILRLEPGRRGAVVGLERTAARIGDDRALARALAEEARLAEDGSDVLALRVRSAHVLARVDPARAASLVQEVLAQDPQHSGAREFETRLHEEAGRWALAAESLRARLDLAVSTKERVSLWLELAQVYDVRLRDPKAAVAALQEARRADPIHPVPPEEIARVLEATGDDRALRAAIEQLAQDAITPQERARHLTLAAEIDELRLKDDVGAASLYARALAETPDDERIADRLVRVLARRVVTTAGGPGPRGFESAAWGELLGQLTRRAEKATPAEALACSFQIASLLVAANQDPARARQLLSAVHGADPRHPGALRLLEAVARRSARAEDLASALALSSEHFSDVRARVGALWEIAALEAWRLPSGDSVATYTRILELDPTDPSALEAAVRLALGPARRGDASARRAAVAALRSLAGLAIDDSSRLATELRLALLLEAHAMDPVTERDAMHAAAREALERFRDALAIDPLSVVAATSLARIANRLGDASGAATAAISLAELSVQPKVRAKYLVDAANLLLGDGADDFGPVDERVERAAQLLEKALAADANSTVAATRLSQVRVAQRRSERLIDVFRAALAVATATDTIVFVGSEIARVARDDLRDPGVAVEAMRAVRAAAPDHVPSLLTLGELFIAQRAWPEAVDALEDIVRRGKERAPRITALFALASIYEKVLEQPEEAERSLRAALVIDPENPRALRALVHRLAAKQGEPTPDGLPVNKTAARLEIASLLDRLAQVETDPQVKADILLELADIRTALKDPGHAEKALVEAVATAPDHARAFERLARAFRLARAEGEAQIDAVSYARALVAVVARGQQLGTTSARWFATLGHVEVAELGRLRDGVAHLQRAVQLDPSLHESRRELASAYERLGAHADAAKTLLGMLTPTATPLVSLADPAGALELLERALDGDRRQEEGIVVSELRAIGGALDEGRHAWLRARRLPAFDQHHTVLDRASLFTHAVPVEAHHVLLDIAGAILGIETKLLRADVSELGLSSRDRVSKRSGNPTRALLDRLCKALGLSDVELVITPNVSRTRVIAQDALWVVVPRSLTELPEPTQMATLGRALARIALGVPWLEELPPAHIEALLVAAGRAVNPTYAHGDASPLVAQYEANVSKDLSRKQKQALERLVPTMNARGPGQAGRAVGIDVLIGGVARAELRIAYVLTGDLLATIDELRGLDASFLEATSTPGRGSLAAVLEHPFAGDVVRFALTREASALRRRVGSAWAS